MRINRSYIALAGCVAALVAGCNDDDTPDDVITTRASATADFSEYQTFAFPSASDVDDEDRPTIPSNVAANLDVVNDAIREELTSLGLQEVDAEDNPDLSAFSLAATNDQSALTWECVEGYWYGYWSYAWDPCAWLAPVYVEYTKGTIVVALADPEREEVVFGGLIEGIEDDDDDIEDRIEDGVEEVFDDYPVDETDDNEI